MARPQDSERYDLTDAEKRDLIRLIEQGKSLSEKYRFVLFDDKREVELVWNSKSREVESGGAGRRPVCQEVGEGRTVLGEATIHAREVWIALPVHILNPITIGTAGTFGTTGTDFFSRIEAESVALAVVLDALEVKPSVVVVVESSLALVAAHNHMVERAVTLNSGLSRQRKTPSLGKSPSNTTQYSDPKSGRQALMDFQEEYG